MSAHPTSRRQRERLNPSGPWNPFKNVMAGEIAEVRRSGGELCLDWRIPRFLDLPFGVLDRYESPRFGFHDARWYLSVFPHWRNSFGVLHLSLRRDVDDGGPSTRTVILTLGVRVSGGGVGKRTEEVEREFEKGGGCDLSSICGRWELVEQKERLMPGGTITFVCQMRVPGTAATGASSSPDVPNRTDTQSRESNAPTCKCQSLNKQDASTQTEAENKEAGVDDKQSSEKRDIEEKVLEDMGKLLDSGNMSDVTVQVQETEFRVHSSILCARSPVLSAMLEHDTLERNSRRINIEHCRPEVFGEYLRYLYTGSVRSLSPRTAFGLYGVADQYLADDLKLLCLQHVRDTLCVQTFCDTVTLAVTHGESDLLRLAVDFATQNFSSIVISVEWQKFISEYPREANEILVKCFGPRG